MNGVMGMTSLLLGTPLSAQQREYAETVRSSAESLLELLNDILDLSKVEADRLELEVLDFDLQQLVRDVVHLLRIAAEQKASASPRPLRTTSGPRCAAIPADCGRS